MDLTVREMVRGDVAIWYIFRMGKVMLISHANEAEYSISS